MTRAERLDYWRERLSSYQSSQLGVVEWCRQNSVCVKSFYRWRRTLQQPSVDSPAGEWLAVTGDALPPPPPSLEPTPSGVTLRLGPATIEIMREFDTGVLAAVVRVLQEAATC